MKKNSTLKELLIGIGLVGILIQILCLIFWKNYLYYSIGLWAGILIAVGMVVHMQRSIEDGLDLMGDAGVKYMKKAYFMRTALAAIAIAVVLYFDWGNPLTLLLGIMTLKVSVYLQPWVHNILEKKKKGA